MTGYAHRSEDTALGRSTIELRSVNSRFTDLQFRLSDELRPIEPLLRELITRSVSRGKIECRMQLRGRDPVAGPLQVNEALILGLAQANAQVRGLVPDAAPMTVADYLRWQGAGAAGAGDEGGEYDLSPERLWLPLQAMVQRAMADFIASREREGERLAGAIETQVAEMTAIAVRLKPLIPELLEATQARLTARLAEAMPQAAGGIPPEETFARIRQEVALLGLRGDVTEEFERLSIHFAEVLRALAHGGALGKRLDFLTQELNREANTLASKASGVAVTDGAVALKLLIEQMREQVQNIE
ncbi:MAG: YicC/YloC family endoribonuclease [Lautropia sp.]